MQFPEGHTVIVAVDFGASTTKTAVLRQYGGVAELVAVGGSVEFPTAIYLAADATVEVGERAVALQGSDPLRFDARLKQRINHRTPVSAMQRVVRLGSDDSLSLVDAVTAVLKHALDASVGVLGSAPQRLVLTHPAAWEDDERELLTAAVRKAGFAGEPEFAAEPESAAHYHLTENKALRKPIAVFDLGASTYDAAILVDNGGKLVSRFLDGRLAGGDDFDSAILDLVATRLPAADHARFEQLRSSDQWSYDLADEARDVKERLSTEDSVYFAFDSLPDVLITRADFDEAIRTSVEDCVAVLADAIDALPANPGLGSIVLSGGSSRVPLVRDLVQDLAGRHGAAVLAVDGKVGPGQVVALGAVRIPQPPPPPEPPKVYYPSSSPSASSEPVPTAVQVVAGAMFPIPMYIAKKIKDNPEKVEAVKAAAKAQVEIFRSMFRRKK
jgi:molecular chaperone DnaK (HSP70)